MTKFIAILTIAFLSGCYGSQLAQMRRDNEALREQNRRAWAELRKRDARSGGNTSQDDRPVPPPGGAATIGGDVQTSTMLARKPHGPYMGTIGAQPRQVDQGPKLHFKNLVCDPKSRGVWSDCTDRDHLNGEDYNYYLAFDIDTVNPTEFPATFYRDPASGEALMPPNSEAYISLGGSCVVNVKVKAYRDDGGYQSDAFGQMVWVHKFRLWKTKTYRFDDACDGEAYKEFAESSF